MPAKQIPAHLKAYEELSWQRGRRVWTAPATTPPARVIYDPIVSRFMMGQEIGAFEPKSQSIMISFVNLMHKFGAKFLAFVMGHELGHLFDLPEDENGAEALRLAVRLAIGPDNRDQYVANLFTDTRIHGLMYEAGETDPTKKTEVIGFLRKVSKGQCSDLWKVHALTHEGLFQLGVFKNRVRRIFRFSLTDQMKQDVTALVEIMRQACALSKTDNNFRLKIMELLQAYAKIIIKYIDEQSMADLMARIGMSGKGSMGSGGKASSQQMSGTEGAMVGYLKQAASQAGQLSPRLQGVLGKLGGLSTPSSGKLSPNSPDQAKLDQLGQQLDQINGQLAQSAGIEDLLRRLAQGQITNQQSIAAAVADLSRQAQAGQVPSEDLRGAIDQMRRASIRGELNGIKQQAQGIIAQVDEQRRQVSEIGQQMSGVNQPNNGKADAVAGKLSGLADRLNPQAQSGLEGLEQAMAGVRSHFEELEAAVNNPENREQARRLQGKLDRVEENMKAREAQYRQGIKQTAAQAGQQIRQHLHDLQQQQAAIQQQLGQAQIAASNQPSLQNLSKAKQLQQQAAALNQQQGKLAAINSELEQLLNKVGSSEVLDVSRRLQGLADRAENLGLSSFAQDVAAEIARGVQQAQQNHPFASQNTQDLDGLDLEQLKEMERFAGNLRRVQELEQDLAARQLDDAVQRIRETLEQARKTGSKEAEKDVISQIKQALQDLIGQSRAEELATDNLQNYMDLMRQLGVGKAQAKQLPAAPSKPAQSKPSAQSKEELSGEMSMGELISEAQEGSEQDSFAQEMKARLGQALSKGHGKGIGRGRGKGGFQILSPEALLYYQTIVDRYEIKFPRTKRKSQKVDLKSFVVPQALDASRDKTDFPASISMYGRPTPDTLRTRRIERIEAELEIEEELEKPDLEEIIDSSGSMPDPAARVSEHAISAMIASHSALNAGVKVKVTNFSGDGQYRTTEYSGSEDRDKLDEELTGYYGGGTTVPVEAIGENPGRKRYIILTTDLGLSNEPATLDKVKKILELDKPQAERMTIGMTIFFEGSGDFEAKAKQFRDLGVNVWKAEAEIVRDRTLKITRELYGD